MEGTRNVLQLCRATGIRQFYHVSTAYVCGLRKGQVLEDELDETGSFTASALASRITNSFDSMGAPWPSMRAGRLPWPR